MSLTLIIAIVWLAACILAALWFTGVQQHYERIRRAARERKALEDLWKL